MPMSALARSSAGQACARPLAATASWTVAPPGTSTCHSRTSRGAGQYATVICTGLVAVDLLGALDEGVHEVAGDLVEHGPDQSRQGGVLEAVVQLQPDPAGTLPGLADRRELPVAVQVGERPV